MPRAGMEWICVTCGVQHADASVPPPACAVCSDERQYVGLAGQQWTTLAELRGAHSVRLAREEDALTSLEIQPKFGIGQRAFLVGTPDGNLLWDCLSLLDDPAADYIQHAGGISAIAISHPHYYAAVVEWSRAFGGAPIYLHQDDAPWVMRPDRAIEFWAGESKRLFGGLTLVRCGGHFPGGAVLHWPSGAAGRGALLSGDIIQVVPDRRWVSFMYSYPNLIPLDAASVRRIVAAVEPFPFDRIYGAFPYMTVAQDGRGAVRRSADRYLRALGAPPL